MQLSKLVEKFRLLYNGMVYECKDNNCLYIAVDTHGIALFLPQKVGSIKVRKGIEIFFYYENMKCLHSKKNRVENVYAIIDDWLSKRHVITSMQRKYDYIEMIPGGLLLEKDVKLYIKWKWDDMVSKPNQIDLLGYRPVFELFKSKEISNLFPVFHPFEGLSVSTILNGRAAFPFINFNEGQYTIHQREKGKELLNLPCLWENLYATYRNYLPKKIAWARCPDKFF